MSESTDEMKIAVFPLDIQYADPSANLRSILDREIEPDTRLLVLPELFSTGFIKNPEKQALLAETDDGPTLTALREYANRNNIAVAGTFLSGKAPGPYFNRAFFISPDGAAIFYNKHHLFTYSGEDKVLAAGSEQSPVIDYLGWKIKLMVCYDLRFPVWSRNCGLEYDMILYPANWPDARQFAFRHLLIARAIENQAVVIGANRGGSDPWGNYPAEMCSVVDWRGNSVGQVRNGILYASLSHQKLDEFRAKYPFHLDADNFTIN